MEFAIGAGEHRPPIDWRRDGKARSEGCHERGDDRRGQVLFGDGDEAPLPAGTNLYERRSKYIDVELARRHAVFDQGHRGRTRLAWGPLDEQIGEKVRLSRGCHEVPRKASATSARMRDSSAG